MFLSLPACLCEHRFDQDGEMFTRRLAAMRRKVMQNNAMAKGWPQQVIDEYAVRLLREDLARDMGLPAFEEYRDQEQPCLL